MYNCIYCSILLYMYTIVILYVRVYITVYVQQDHWWEAWFLCRHVLTIFGFFAGRNEKKMILLLVNHDIHTSNSCLVLRFLRGQTQVTAGKSLFFKYLCQYIFIKKRAFEYINYWFFSLKYCFKYEMQNKKNLKFKWRAGVCFRRNGKCFLVAKESVFIGAIAHAHVF